MIVIWAIIHNPLAVQGEVDRRAIVTSENLQINP